MALGVEGVRLQRRLVVSRNDMIPFSGRLSSSNDLKAVPYRDSFVSGLNEWSIVYAVLLMLSMCDMNLSSPFVQYHRNRPPSPRSLKAIIRMIRIVSIPRTRPPRNRTDSIIQKVTMPCRAESPPNLSAIPSLSSLVESSPSHSVSQPPLLISASNFLEIMVGMPCCNHMFLDRAS